MTAKTPAQRQCFNKLHLIWMIPAGTWAIMFGLWLFVGFLTLGGLPLLLLFDNGVPPWLWLVNIGMIVTLILVCGSELLGHGR